MSLQDPEQFAFHDWSMKRGSITARGGNGSARAPIDRRAYSLTA
jgi:hypothetical protein